MRAKVLLALPAWGRDRRSWRHQWPVGQPEAVQVRWLLGLWSALALVVGLTVAVEGALDLGTSAGDQVVGGGAAPATPSTDAPAEVLRPDQARVAGTVTRLRLGDAVLEPRTLGLPLTVEADRGSGNGARISGAVVAERPSIIEWDAGRPLTLSGDGTLELAEVDVELVEAGPRLRLGGRSHRLAEGSYRIDAPVAVGSVGLTTSRDSVSFTTTRAGAELAARGDAGITLPGATLLLLGPGSVELAGALSVTTAEATEPAAHLTMDEGRFEITIRPGPEGAWAVEALLQGPFEVAAPEGGVPQGGE